MKLKQHIKLSESNVFLHDTTTCTLIFDVTQDFLQKFKRKNLLAYDFEVFYQLKKDLREQYFQFDNDMNTITKN